jgi:hypothetical protein
MVLRVQPQNPPDEVTPVRGDGEVLDRPGARNRRLDRAARRRVEAVQGPLIDNLFCAGRRDPEASAVGCELHRRARADGNLARRADGPAGVGPKALDHVPLNGHGDHFTVGSVGDVVESGPVRKDLLQGRHGLGPGRQIRPDHPFQRARLRVVGRERLECPYE